MRGFENGPRNVPALAGGAASRAIFTAYRPASGSIGTRPKEGSTFFTGTPNCAAAAATEAFAASSFTVIFTVSCVSRGNVQPRRRNHRFEHTIPVVGVPTGTAI